MLVGGVFGEVLACPSAVELDGIAGCLLDCEENERARPLGDRDPGRIEGDDLWPHLSWSAWLRVHRVDPQFFPRPIRSVNGGRVAPWLRWERWERWRRGDPRWQFARVDTTVSPPDAVAAELSAWVESERARRDDGTLPLAGRWWG